MSRKGDNIPTIKFNIHMGPPQDLQRALNNLDKITKYINQTQIICVGVKLVLLDPNSSLSMVKDKTRTTIDT